MSRQVVWVRGLEVARRWKVGVLGEDHQVSLGESPKYRAAEPPLICQAATRGPKVPASVSVYPAKEKHKIPIRSNSIRARQSALARALRRSSAVGLAVDFASSDPQRGFECFD
jgi:hypothetical protein